jgi:hypothetical protein
VCEEWGRLGVPGPLPVVDGLMAATAKVRGWTFVTRNVATPTPTTGTAGSAPRTTAAWSANGRSFWTIDEGWDFFWFNRDDTVFIEGTGTHF